MRVVLCILLAATAANAHDAWIEPRPTLHGAELRLILGEHLVPEKPLQFTGMIAVARAPFLVDLDAATFNHYLAEEGHDVGLRTDRAVRERVTRHLKTFAGAAFDASFTQPFGTRLEIVPLTIPEAGKPLRVVVMFEGKPLAGVRLSFFGGAAAVVRTNARGEGEAIVKHGLVLVRTTHIRRGSDVDFESDWAALTFIVE